MLFTAVVAGFTAFLAVVTRDLWKSTRDLEVGARDQHETLKESVAAAKKAADAALLSANTAKAQLIASGHPLLTVRRLAIDRLALNERLDIHFIVANIGGSDAKILDYDFTITVLPTERLPATPPMTKIAQPIEESAFFSPGPGRGYSVRSSNPLSQFELDTITNQNLIGLMLVGYIAYSDGNGRDRYMSFGRRYDPLRHRFFAVDDENYEYSD